MSPLHRSKILHEKSKHLTNWLEFTEIDYQDEAGQSRSWEAVHRRFQQGCDHRCATSAKWEIHPCSSISSPTGGYVLEFPLGLVDSSETPAEAALRDE